jgi:excisionase family DNA binding protein
MRETPYMSPLEMENHPMNALLDHPDTAIPSDEDAKLATEASRVLAKNPGAELKVQVNNETMVLPRAARHLLSHLLTEMSRGNAVTLIPVHAELTTQEAADYLNVSRPYLIQLLESGKIKYHKTGTHRRVKFVELEEYRRKTEAARQKAMEELALQAQELGMGY